MIRLIRILFLLACLFTPLLVHAQAPVQPWADWTSYGTAMVNPATAVVEAWQSPSRGCRLGRLALSEAIGNGVALTLKHFIVSPRPCLGCAPDGMPSGHTMNSAIGMFSSRWGFTATIATGVLRHEANRHTWTQIAAGAALGVGAEAAGRLIKCQ
jgi:membrane-associated phospholipid phosphatase